MPTTSHLLVSLLRERGGNPLEADQIIDFEQMFAGPSRFHPGHNIHSVADQEEDAAAATPYAGDPMAGGGGGGMPPPAAGEMGAPGGAPPEDSELTDMNTVPPAAQPGGGVGADMGQQPGQPQIPGMQQESRVDERGFNWGGVMPHAFMGGHGGGGGFPGMPGGGGFPGMPGGMQMPWMRPPAYGTAGQYPQQYQGGGGGGGYAPQRPGALPPVRPNIPSNPVRPQPGQPTATAPAAAGPAMAADINMAIPHYGTEAGGDPFKAGADNTPNPFKRAPGAPATTPGAPPVAGGPATTTTTGNVATAAAAADKAAAAGAPAVAATKKTANDAAERKTLDDKYGDQSTYAGRFNYYQDTPASHFAQQLPIVGDLAAAGASGLNAIWNYSKYKPVEETPPEAGAAATPPATPPAVAAPDKTPQNSSREYIMPSDYFSLAEEADSYDRFLNELLRLDEAPPTTADLNRQELARLSGGAQQNTGQSPTYDYYSAPGVGQRFDGSAAPAASGAAAPAAGGGGGARAPRAATGGGGASRARAGGGGGARMAAAGMGAIPEVPRYDGAGNKITTNLNTPAGGAAAPAAGGAAAPARIGSRDPTDFEYTPPARPGSRDPTDFEYTPPARTAPPAEKTGPYGAIGDVASSVYNAMPTIFPSRNPATAAAKPPATNPAVAGAAPNLTGAGGVLNRAGAATNPAVASAPTPPPGGLVAGGALNGARGDTGLQQPQPPRPTVTQNPGASSGPNLVPGGKAPGAPPAPSGSAGLDLKDWKMSWNDFMVLSESEKRR